MTERQPQAKPIRGVAILITVVLCAIAIHQELTTSGVDSFLLGLLVVLTFFWAGQGVDEIAKKVLR